MSQHNEAPKAHLTTVAEFPKNYFLENLAVRSDNSILITAMNHGELWYVSAADGDECRSHPCCCTSLTCLTMGIAEAELRCLPHAWPVTSTPPMESVLYKIDLRRWRPGGPIEPRALLHVSEKPRLAG